MMTTAPLALCTLRARCSFRVSLRSSPLHIVVSAILRLPRDHEHDKYQRTDASFIDLRTHTALARYARTSLASPTLPLIAPLQPGILIPNTARFPLGHSVFGCPKLVRTRPPRRCPAPHEIADPPPSAICSIFAIAPSPILSIPPQASAPRALFANTNACLRAQEDLGVPAAIQTFALAHCAMRVSDRILSWFVLEYSVARVAPIFVDRHATNLTPAHRDMPAATYTRSTLPLDSKRTTTGQSIYVVLTFYSCVKSAQFHTEVGVCLPNYLNPIVRRVCIALETSFPGLICMFLIGTTVVYEYLPSFLPPFSFYVESSRERVAEVSTVSLEDSSNHRPQLHASAGMIFFEDRVPTLVNPAAQATTMVQEPAK
ncbi:hypothetical protein C8R44DRAFT_877736 [Mycena epipterygia]|nr:hypothetical protein C8R44DRAFT_877736 [Mycena epipterygia]